MSPVELSRRCAVASIPAGGREITVEADAAECLAIARRMDLPAVHRLTCTFRLRPERGGRIVAAATLAATIEQTCVVTLEPFAVIIEEPFSLRFVPAGAESEDCGPGSPDEIAYTDETLDLGEAAAEQLALSLDPYPRSPAAASAGTMPVSSVPGPFAALARLRRDH